MTKEEKKRKEHNEYVKWWNKQSETYKEYQKEYHREYRKKHRGFYIYFFLDANGEIVYIGKTTNLRNRMSWHKCTREYWREGFVCLYKEFYNIDDYILTELEQSLIDICRPRLNKECNDYDGNVDKYLRGFKELKEFKM